MEITRIPSFQGGVTFKTTSSFDLILPKNGSLTTPVFFLNRQLPQVLCKIAQEKENYQQELWLQHKLRGQDKRLLPSLRSSWYRSILENTYTSQYIKSIHAEFSLSAEVWQSPPGSVFWYIRLNLPPLWQEQAYRPKTAQLLCHLGRGQHSLLWYGVLKDFKQEKRIFSGTKVREDSDGF